ncbi:MAG: Cell division protein ftsA [Parcubacteria group bacterium GW2011_GWA2_43_17]|nr:MAG: Cell division protein ftsA [Parcubacteria group bacterium GW2011_GWA2_43_17]KKT92199.1 MAG: Cell division protein ftsA [Parcubacteria group bacterium GW2011_GWF2_45_11]KKT98835.1 MAG: Cell division protein ftsA [Parcubacteria group bacterium GW2011_GWC2_45_15]OGY94088.1 MAG: cell division protein FtsA [Candidatus Komeilibacteria bacterium RIFOXYA2_FULL_45_9]OGY96138.1 MAG: cell division protein FtsA [Candidatus Komeilibacteria bacterium RIFOXYC2_FULL_45_12]HAH04293.1 cell division prot
MPQDHYITGLDIGSHNIRAVLIKKTPDNNLEIIGAAERPSAGIAKGMVTDIEDAVSSISEVLEQLERMAGLPVESAVVGIFGTHIKTLESSGVVAVAKADKEITEEDVERAIEAAQAVATPPNHEILHVIPRDFKVDNQTGIKDPVGMTGVRLEVATQIIIGLSAQIKNLTKSIYRTGVDITDLVFGILACAESTLDKKQRELGVALVNLGHHTTTMIVYEEGDILHSAVLPIGSSHITSDIAIGLRTSVDAAEIIKLEVAQADSRKVNKRDEIDLAKFSDQEKERTMISVKHVSEIVQARCEEIFSLINAELKKIDRFGLLPAGVVLTGGGAKLNGLIDLAKEKLKLPVVIGLPQGAAESSIDKINDPSYATAIGLAIWGSQSSHKSAKFRLPNFSSVDDAVSKMKRWFKSLLP